MITYLKGDIFNSPSKVLVNTVNTVGVMGKGIALEFKKQYPGMFDRYKEICANKELNIGNLFLWKDSKKWVLLFPTKAHWRNPSKIEYIESGLKKFAETWDQFGADTFAFPKLGCGNGGLPWDEVKPLMEKYLRNLPIQVYVYVDYYKEAQQENGVAEIGQWVNGEQDAGGYERFKLQLHNLIASDKDGSLLDQQLTNIPDEELCDLWDYVRDVGVVISNEMPGIFRPYADGVLKAMQKMNYLQSVIVSGDGQFFDSRTDVYQYIGG